MLYSHTYSRNPLGCRIAVEILKIFKEENIMDIVEKKGKFLQEKMREYFHGKNYIKNYRHLGMIGAIELKEIEGVERVGRRIAAIALEKGVLIRPIGNIVYFMPPYIITEEEINTMLQVCQESIEEFLHTI